MKSRIVQTRFWDDEDVLNLGKFARYLYIYLLTSSYINICGIFQLANSKIMFETGMTPKDLEVAQSELATKPKVLFKDGWVYVVNARKNNRYEASEDNRKACLKELSNVPSVIKEHFDSSVDSTVRVLPTVTINKKQEIINNKELITKEEKENLVDLLSRKMDKSLAETELNKFISYWTEKNHSGTKERWQLEKTFEVQKRLATWFSRIKTYGGKNEPRGVRL